MCDNSVKFRNRQSWVICLEIRIFEIQSGSGSLPHLGPPNSPPLVLLLPALTSSVSLYLYASLKEKQGEG